MKMKLTDAERSLLDLLLTKEADTQIGIIEHGQNQNFQTPYYFDKTVDRVKHYAAVLSLILKLR